MSANAYISKITEYIQNYTKKNNIPRVVLGISGGVDSAVTLKLAIDALGPQKVTAIGMPELGISSDTNVKHARELTEFLGATYISQPINPFVTDFNNIAWKPGPLAEINTKARIRAVLLYSYANTYNALVLGTSNKSEILLGYGTKYGDLAADIYVLGDLYKTEVIEVGRQLGLPEVILTKEPTAELKEGQTDAAELGASYNRLDPILKQIELGKDALMNKGMDPLLLNNIFRLYEGNKHKSKLPPIIKVH